MITKCSECRFYKASAQIKNIGNCSYHDAKVRGCDRACPSSVKAK